MSSTIRDINTRYSFDTAAAVSTTAGASANGLFTRYLSAEMGQGQDSTGAGATTQASFATLAAAGDSVEALRSEMAGRLRQSSGTAAAAYGIKQDGGWKSVAQRSENGVTFNDLSMEPTAYDPDFEVGPSIEGG